MRSNNVQSTLIVLTELLTKMSSLFFQVPCIKTHKTLIGPQSGVQVFSPKLLVCPLPVNRKSFRSFFTFD